MDKQRVLVELHEDIKTLTGGIGFTVESISDTEGKLQKYFDVMKKVIELPDIGSLNAIEKVTVLNDSTNNTEVSEVKKAYVFERRLRGGQLQGKDCFVPEQIVRDLEIEHGDLVYAVDDGLTGKGKPKHKFEVAERRNMPPNEDRVVIPYAIVDTDFEDGCLCVKMDMSRNPIMVNGKTEPLRLPEGDVENLGVVSGDAIDVAYSKSNPDIVRVVWRYDSDFVMDFSNTVTFSKKKEKVKKAYQQTLKGKTVLMVGFEPGRAKMEEEVTGRGGKFLWLHGKKEREVTIRKNLEKADVAILMLEFIGHGGNGSGTKGVVKLSKEMDVKFASMHPVGRSLFINKVYEQLGITTAEDKTVVSS
ncbi:hypothetical protein [Bacillus sp. NEAU-Y102]